MEGPTRITSMTLHVYIRSSTTTKSQEFQVRGSASSAVALRLAAWDATSLAILRTGLLNILMHTISYSKHASRHKRYYYMGESSNYARAENQCDSND